MTEKNVRIGIDARPARAGARVYQRSASDIIRKSREMDRSSSKADRSIKRLGGSLTGVAAAARIAEGPLGRVAGRLTAIQTAGAGLAPAIIGVGAAIAGLGFALGKGVSVGTQFERLYARIDGLLQATGAAAGRTSGEITALAQAIDRTTLQSKAGALDAAGVLLTFLNIQGKQFDRTLRLSADVAEVMGGDMKSAALQLAKALENPVIGLTMLRRVGISFTDAQKDMIVQMFKAGQVAKAQGKILQQIERQLGGVAQAAASGTVAGALDGLVFRLGEVFETIGGQALPALRRQLGELASAISTPAFLQGARTLGQVLGAAFAGLSQVLQLVIKNFNLLVGVVTFFATRALLGLLVPAVARVVGSLTLYVTTLGLVKGATVAATVAVQAFSRVMRFSGVGIMINLLAGLGTMFLLVGNRAKFMTSAMQNVVTTVNQASDRVNRLAVSSRGAAADLRKLTNESIAAAIATSRLAVENQKARVADLEGKLNAGRGTAAGVFREPRDVLALQTAKRRLDFLRNTQLQAKSLIDTLNEIRRLRAASGVSGGANTAAAGIARLQRATNRLATARTQTATRQVRFDADDLLRQILESRRSDPFAGIMLGMKDIADEWNNVNGQMRNMWTETTTGFKDALKGFIRTGRLDMRKFFNDLADRALDTGLKILFGLAQRGLFGLFSNSAGGGAVSALNSIFKNVSAIFSHSGGVVGQANARKMVNPLLFAGAPRLHNGLRSDEFPAILQRGEEVISARDVAAQRRGGGRERSVNVIVNAPPGTTVETERREGLAETDIILTLKREVAQDITDNGLVGRAVKQRFGLREATGI